MIKKTFWLQCDICKDVFWDSSDYVVSLRKKARKDGWNYSRVGGDVCDRCKEKR